MEEPDVMETYNILSYVIDWLTQVGVPLDFAKVLSIVIGLLVIISLAWLAGYIVKTILVGSLNKINKKTTIGWNDFFIRRRVLHNLSHIVPALVIKYVAVITLAPQHQNLYLFVDKLSDIYIIGILVLVCTSLLSVAHDLYQTTQSAKTKPIKGYIQLINVLVYMFGGVFIISILIDKDPLTLLVGMSASAAVLMFIFKDTLLGLVASVQVSANDMVKPGDWIEIPGRNVDGVVLELTLNTVKVQNWDRTISTIPTYALVSESFTNWKGMEESDGRRIKRSIFIDMRSVKFCSEELLNKLKKIQLLEDYLNKSSEEIRHYNKLMNFDETMPVNGRRLTNIGVFRIYLQEYLKHNPLINQTGFLVVRQLQPSDRGIPLEVYCFSTMKTFVLFEGVQADIFDHILAVVPEFELKIFQSPTGDDFKQTFNRD